MITSRQNGLVKRIRALKDKKNRDKSGEYVVEGAKLVAEAATLGETIISLVATESGSELIHGINLVPEILSDDVFKSVSEEVSPQGVLAIVAKKRCDFNKVSGRCVMLDGVSDPANVGAVIRSAAAFGFNTVLIADGADAYASKAVRASMGGIFRTKILSGTRADIIGAVQVPFIVADMGGKPLNESQVPNEFCLVIGNEAHGVSDEMKSLANQTVAIPMESGMESLNAAVSAGIMMYALTLKH